MVLMKAIRFNKIGDNRIWFTAVRDIDDWRKGTIDVMWDRRSGRFSPCACTHAIYRKHELDWCYHLKAADLILDLLNVKRPNKKHLAAKFIKPTSRKINEFVKHPWNSEQHEKAKLKVFEHARHLGYDVIVEGTLKTGGRPDVVVLDTMEIVEVMYSENILDAVEKASKYPGEFKIHMIKADAILDPDWRFPGKIYKSQPPDTSEPNGTDNTR
jgi:hypothetical protein